VTRAHYPFRVYAWGALCALGVAAVAIGIADGWLLVALGVVAIVVSLLRLHVTLDRRRCGPGMSPLPLARGPMPKRR